MPPAETMEPTRLSRSTGSHRASTCTWTVTSGGSSFPARGGGSARFRSGYELRQIDDRSVCFRRAEFLGVSVSRSGVRAVSRAAVITVPARSITPVPGRRSFSFQGREIISRAVHRCTNCFPRARLLLSAVGMRPARSGRMRTSEAEETGRRMLEPGWQNEGPPRQRGGLSSFQGRSFVLPA